MKSSHLNGTAVLLTPQSDSRALQSELEGVSDDAWTKFCINMKVQKSTAKSAHGGLGMFDMRMPRLADLDLVDNLRRVRLDSGLSSWEADWKAPLDEMSFLASASIQYKVFSTSMKLYHEQIRSGAIRIPRTKERLTMSAWLAILHKAGPVGLAQWGDESKRRPNTVELVKKVNGIF